MGEKIRVSRGGGDKRRNTDHPVILSLTSQDSLAEMKALGNGKKDAPAVLYGTRNQSPELVTSPASLRLSSGQQGGQASPWSQSEEQTGRAEVLTLGICQAESSYFLLKIPRIQDFQSNLLGVQPA